MLDCCGIAFTVKILKSKLQNKKSHRWSPGGFSINAAYCQSLDPLPTSASTCERISILTLNPLGTGAWLSAPFAER